MWANVLGGLVGAALGLLLVGWALRLLWRLGTSGPPPPPLPPSARSQPFGALPGVGSVGALGRLHPGADLDPGSESDLLGPGT